MVYIPYVNKHVCEEAPSFCSLARTVYEELCNRTLCALNTVCHNHIVHEQTYLKQLYANLRFKTRL